MTYIKPEHDVGPDDQLTTAIGQEQMDCNVPFRAGSHISATPGPSHAAHPNHIVGSTPVDAVIDNAVSPDGDTDMPDLSQPSAMQMLGNRSRHLIQVIQRLEALNISSTLPSLPKFVVIGDQSVGKSSIIEATCDITLPRSEGTCTRCPFKITTTAKDGPWECKIEIQTLYSYTPGSSAKVSRSTFDNWLDKDHPEHVHFDTINNKGQLDLALHRAQLAVLNPAKHPSYFVNAPINGAMHYAGQGIGFSPNIIHLEISAPKLPELSLYDLPGAINTLGDESQQFLVDFVEALLKSYIKDEGAFILLTCAANLDLEVSTALRYLRQCAATHRSMVILTKPDLMEYTEKRVSDLKQLLLGESGYYTFGDGCFVTRQLSQKQLDSETPITHEEARRMEAEFFAGEPWSSRLVAHADRFGIPNLQKAVSQKLTTHILHGLPQIVERVQVRLAFVEGELSTFPVKDAAPHITVHTSIEQVTKTIVEQIHADSNKSAFRSPYREIFRKLAKKFADGKPEVKVDTPGYVKPSISLDTEDEELEESPSKRKQLNNGRTMSSTPAVGSSKSVRRRNTPATTRSNNGSSDDNEVAGKVTFLLDEVKNKFDAAPGADIPGQVSEAVVRDLILETLRGWKYMISSSVKKIRDLFQDMLQSSILKALASFSETELFREVNRVTQDLFTELIKDACDVITKMISSETNRPITYNKLISQKKAMHEAALQNARQVRRTDEHYDTLESKGYIKLPTKGEQHKKALDPVWVTQTIGADEYDREVKALATPLAYYEIASAQLVDSIAKQLEYGLMYQYEERLYKKLLEDLNIMDIQHCMQLLAEDPAREHARYELEEEKDKLNKALSELHNLPATHA